MLKDFTPRLYQETILDTANKKNTLVVLPTGLGKTALAFLLAAQRLHQYPDSKILILAPTKPLCEQHLNSFRQHLDIDPEKVVLFTGEVPPAKRAELWKQATVIVSTPQGLENDVINGTVRLEEVSLLTFDEAHHAVGEYSYVWLAKQYDKTAAYPRVLGLTASPGDDLETIKEVCQNLGIEAVEVRTPTDPDVEPYVQLVEHQVVKVQLPDEFKRIKDFLTRCFQSKIKAAQEQLLIPLPDNKMELLKIQSQLQGKIAAGQRDFSVLKSISLLAEAIKVEHARELLETQGIDPLYHYLKKIKDESLTTKVKAVKNLVVDTYFKSAFVLTENLFSQRVKHPKLLKLKELVQEQFQNNPQSKIIVFSQFRDSGVSIVEELQSITGVHANLFVGQAKKGTTGSTQKEQKEIIEKFREGTINILIATSVGEEGLDIPQVHKVIFYEPVPSAIRSIQRRGRTGRLEKGQVVLLMTEGTRDVGYRWSAHHKEKRMYQTLEKIKKEFVLTKEPTLQPFLEKEQQVLIVADYREKGNQVIKQVMDLGLSVRLESLSSADYILSGRVGVELKTVPDFVHSIIDGRLLSQVRELKKNFEKSVVIIEGEEDIYAIRNIHPNAIRGMLASITIGFGVPVMYTKNPQDTAGVLAVIAKREQDKESTFSYHQQKPPSLQEQQEFIASALPGVGPQLAKELLSHFGSIRRLFSASKEELQQVEGVGEKISERILQVVEKKYQQEFT